MYSKSARFREIKPTQMIPLCTDLAAIQFTANYHESLQLTGGAGPYVYTINNSRVC